MRSGAAGALLLLALAACGTPSPQEQADAARARSPELVRLEACAALGDAEAVIGRLRPPSGDDLAATPDLYARLARSAGDAGQLAAAALIADAGQRRFPDAAAGLERVIAEVQAKARQGNDSAALRRLAQLGYVDGIGELAVEPAGATAPASQPATDEADAGQPATDPPPP